MILASAQIGTLDFVLLGVLVLAIVLGYYKGFVSRLMDLIGTALALTLAIILSASLASNLVASIGQGLVKSLISTFNGGSFAIEYNYAGMTIVEFKNALLDGGIPQFITNVIAQPLFDYLPKDTTTFTLAELLGKGLVFLLFLVVSFVVIFILVKLATRALTMVASTMEIGGSLDSIDRILGIVLSVVFAALLITSVFSIIYAFDLTSSIKGLQGYLDNSKLGNLIYNTISDLIGKDLLKYKSQLDSIVNSLK